MRTSMNVSCKRAIDRVAGVGCVCVCVLVALVLLALVAVQRSRHVHPVLCTSKISCLTLHILLTD